MDELAVGGARGSVRAVPTDSGELVIKLDGEIDIANVGELGVAVDALLDGAVGAVVFDLSELEFLDSSGIAVLLRAARRAPSVRLRRPRRVVRRVLEAAGLDDVLPVEP